MAQRHLEQNIKDSHFINARNRDEDRPCNRSCEQRKSEGKDKEHGKNNPKRGDCIRWITKGQCSFGDSCAFKHEPNKKGKRKGRSRSPSPTGSPHRNSEGDGKGSDDGGAKAYRQLAVKEVRQEGNSSRLLRANFERCAAGCIRRQTVSTNTLLDLLMRRYFQQLLQFISRRMMNARCNYRKVQSDDKTQVRVIFHHLANRSVPKK